ncbi:MAG: S46 family peptidase [Hyphomonadaceae bacterium]
MEDRLPPVLKRLVSFARLALAGAGFLALAGPACADEGMWTFDNIPVAALRQAYGWAPDRAWLDRVMGASARIEGGCSAGIVSPEGLVQTNHHCVLECVQNFSTPGNDQSLAGFRAMARAEERRCPGFAVQVVTAITNVTDEIGRATAGVTGENFARARDAAIAAIERRCAGAAASRRCEVVTLYQGGQYKLYAYHRYDDVRLVFAPEIGAAFFGGDPDNFNFPRYCFDVAYLRLYENGRPARTPTHLKLREAPLTEGEMTLVSGNPGGTERLLTTSQLSFQRDYFLPWRLNTLSDLRGRLIAYSAQGPEQARIAAETLFSVENSFKAYYGRRLALADADNFARVTAAEDAFQARVRRNGALAAETGAAWDEISAAISAYRGFYLPYQYAEARAGGGAQLLTWARDLVRAGAERAKPDAERLPRYTDARLATTMQRTLAETPVEAPLEEMLLSFWLSKMREYLTADDPLARKILGAESPEGLAQRLVSQTRLADPAVRRRLWEGGAGAIAASDDPLIVFVRGWDDDARTLRTRYEREVEGPIARAQERIARARFRAFGETIYPDATFTLRLSYGKVAGWTEPDGRAVAPFTRIAGLYARATGQAPYKLAESWVAARAQLQPDTIFDAVTTNDIIGGNSGSPVLDKQGDVVGAAFDGNIHSLGGDYFYDPALNRTVIVTSTAILAGLRHVYGMEALVRELTAP